MLPAGSFFPCTSTSRKDFMFNLHWLPVEKRIDFKTLISVHKIMHNCPAPDYI